MYMYMYLFLITILYIYIYRCFGNRQSLRARQRDRLTMAFESREDAVNRCELQASGTTAKKSSVGRFDKMNWDKEKLKAEIEGYDKNTVVNWSQLAVTYNITNQKGELAKNGGQIAKEWLASVGIDTTQFKRKFEEVDNCDHTRVRRKKKKGAGGEISLPTPSTNENLKKQLQAKISKGEYSIGEMIVPKKVNN